MIKINNIYPNIYSRINIIYELKNSKEFSILLIITYNNIYIFTKEIEF